MKAELNQERISFSRENTLRVSMVGHRLLSTLPPKSGLQRRIKFSSEGIVSGVNAYADLSGNVVITPEMLRFVRDDDELAFVIAHELGHVVKKHPVKAVANRLVGSTAGYLVGSIAEKYAPGAGNGIAAYSAAIVSSPYSKEMEKEADEAALVFMKRAGFDLDAAVRVCRRFAVEIRTPGEGSIIDTHPSTPERLSELTAMVSQMKEVKKAT